MLRMHVMDAWGVPSSCKDFVSCTLPYKLMLTCVSAVRVSAKPVQLSDFFGRQVFVRKDTRHAALLGL
jgi:hypothetical protein